jgi:chorismate synthase
MKINRRKKGEFVKEMRKEKDEFMYVKIYFKGKTMNKE